MKDEADKHRAVCAAADDLQAVVAELNAGHIGRVPPQRALLPTAAVRPNQYRAWQGPGAPTSLPLATSQILTVLSFVPGYPDALTTRVPSGENATEFTGAECPVSVHSCPQPLSDQINIGHGQGRMQRPPCHLRRPRFSQYYRSSHVVLTR